MSAPVPLRYEGDGQFQAVGRFAKECDREYVVGQIYQMVAHEARSMAQHRWYFVALNEAFANLPEDMADRYQSVEHLRKVALIRSGYCDERSIVCGSKAEAQRVAAFIRPIDEYAIVSVSGPVVQVFTAQSQSVRAMGKERFKESVEKVLAFCASLIGVTPDELTKNAEAA